MIRLRGCLLVCSVALPLFACTHLPGPEASADAAGVTRGQAEQGQWELAGRFAAGSASVGSDDAERPEPVAGRFAWQHRSDIDALWLIGPLGNVMAKVEISPNGVRWQDVTGKKGEATNVRALGEALAGVRLPDLPAEAWLRGRWPVSAVQARDAAGWITQAASRGWQFDYRYGAPAPDGWPLGIEGRGPDGLWLRVAFTEWNGRQDPAESVAP